MKSVLIIYGIWDIVVGVLYCMWWEGVAGAEPEGVKLTGVVPRGVVEPIMWPAAVEVLSDRPCVATAWILRGAKLTRYFYGNTHRWDKQYILYCKCGIYCTHLKWKYNLFTDIVKGHYYFLNSLTVNLRVRCSSVYIRFNYQSANACPSIVTLHVATLDHHRYAAGPFYSNKSTPLFIPCELTSVTSCSLMLSVFW